MGCKDFLESGSRRKLKLKGRVVTVWSLKVRLWRNCYNVAEQPVGFYCLPRTGKLWSQTFGEKEKGLLI